MGDWEQGDVVREVEVVVRFRFGVTADDADALAGDVLGLAVDAWLEPREGDEFTVLAYQVTDADPGGARRTRRVTYRRGGTRVSRGEGGCPLVAYQVAGWWEGVDPASERYGCTTECRQVFRAASLAEATRVGLTHDCAPPEARAVAVNLPELNPDQVRELLGLGPIQWEGTDDESRSDGGSGE